MFINIQDLLNLFKELNKEFMFTINTYTDEDYLEMVIDDGLNLARVPEENQTLELCMKALENNSDAFMYVADKTNVELCKAAVKADPFNIGYMKSPSNDLCELAVSLNPSSVKSILNASEDLWLKAIKTIRQYGKILKQWI